MARKPASEQGDTLKEIQTAAFTLFGQYGYDGVSMANVAKAAGISKPSLYWHYKSKTELYIDCLRNLYERIREFLFDPMLLSQSPGLQLMSIFRGLSKLLMEPEIQNGVAGYWMIPNTADIPEISQVQSHFEAETATLLSVIIETGIEQNEFSFQIPVNDMAQAIIAIVEAILIPLRHHNTDTTRRLIGALAHTFYRAHALDPELARLAIDVAKQD